MSSLHLFYNGPFSQWYPSNFVLDGINFSRAEQAMMYFKAVHFGDTKTAAKILATTDPKTQKQLGREVINFDDNEWVRVAQEYVYRINLAKFTQNEDLMYYLLNTDKLELVEASPWDTRWGIGLSQNDPRALDRNQWQGTNWLGEALMRVRDKLNEDGFVLDPDEINFIFPDLRIQKV